MASRITPCIWMDTEAQEAAEFYCSTFKNAHITNVAHYPDNPYKPAGSVMQVEFEIDGQTFTTLNGGPGHQLTDALSLEYRCDDQVELLHLHHRVESALGRGRHRLTAVRQPVPRVAGRTAPAA